MATGRIVISGVSELGVAAYHVPPTFSLSFFLLTLPLPFFVIISNIYRFKWNFPSEIDTFQSIHCNRKSSKIGLESIKISSNIHSSSMCPNLRARKIFIESRGKKKTN